MSDEDGSLLRVAVEELTRRRPPPAGTGEARGRGGPANPGREAAGQRRKRMFMAGRFGPDASRIHYGEDARPPVDGPWELALVVRPR